MNKQGGLEGIVVAETALSDVDGDKGRLILAGDDVEALAPVARFEDVCARLWGAPADEVRAAIGAARARAFASLPRAAIDRPDGMDALRAGLALRAVENDQDWRAAAELTGAVAVLAGAWARLRAREEPVAPDAMRPHADDALRMLRGQAAPPTHARALETYLVTVVDHGMNASTFAARVVASTGSDMVSSIVAAVGALKGPLHGGAPGPVLDMLDEIGQSDRAAAWIRAELAAGRRIMGMGHRVYRVRDPRAAVFERAIAQLDASARLALARAVEQEAERILAERHPDRPLKANVEFYTAVLLEAIGVPRAAFSPTFASGRVAGWCAHVMEQRRTGRLIRPASRYVGALPAVA